MGVDNFEVIHNFKVLAMSECVEGMQCRGDICRIPDHSIIQWEVFVDGMVRKETRSDQHVRKMRLWVPESYLENKVKRVNRLTERLRGVGKDQMTVDEIYDKVVRVMKQGLVEEQVQRVKRGQPWFSRELAQCRKEFHRVEREWLKCDNQEQKRQLRQVCRMKRKGYRGQCMRRKRNLMRKGMMIWKGC